MPRTVPSKPAYRSSTPTSTNYDRDLPPADHTTLGFTRTGNSYVATTYACSYCQTHNLNCTIPPLRLTRTSSSAAKTVTRRSCTACRGTRNLCDMASRGFHWRVEDGVMTKVGKSVSAARTAAKPKVATESNPRLKIKIPARLPSATALSSAPPPSADDDAQAMADTTSDPCSTAERTQSLSKPKPKAKPKPSTKSPHSTIPAIRIPQPKPGDEAGDELASLVGGMSLKSANARLDALAEAAQSLQPSPLHS